MNIIQIARALRLNSTKAEQLLWQQLRNHSTGLKFRRQHPLESRFIVDFYCASIMLIVELDGLIHDIQDVKTKDKERQTFLEQKGYHFIRFRNEELYKDLEEVLEKLNDKIEDLL